MQHTPRAQQVLALARKEAIRFRHNYIGTEHILLGIIRLGQGVAVNVLRKLGVSLDKVSAEVERQVCLLYTSREYVAFCMKSVIEIASRGGTLKKLPNLRYIGVGPMQSQMIKDVPATEELLALVK